MRVRMEAQPGRGWGREEAQDWSGSEQILPVCVSAVSYLRNLHPRV